MQRKIIGSVLGGICMLGACDKSSDNSVPPSVVGTPPPVKVPIAPAVHPTTQQLENQARRNLVLKYVPLSLLAPDSWEVKSIEVGNSPQEVLQGPTPSDEIRFRIGLARPMIGEGSDKLGNQELRLELHAAELQKKAPDLLGAGVVHDITGGKLIEQLAVSELAPTTEELKSASSDTPRSMQVVQWTFTVCVPTGKNFTAYDLSASMPLNQFKVDSPFIRSIMETLKYNAPSSDATMQ